jgi:hypothetical protein
MSIEHTHYYKLIFQNFLKFYFKIKFDHFYAKKHSSYITIHLYKKIACSLIINGLFL